MHASCHSATPNRIRWAAVWAAILFAVASSAAAREPTNNEQLMVEMVNRMRANPQAELSRLVNITPTPAATWGNPKSPDIYTTNALNSFGVSAPILTQQWNALTAIPPVAWNGNLAISSQTYSNLMITRNAQAHDLDGRYTNEGDIDLVARFEASGFFFDGGGWAGENIFAFTENVFHAHAAFAIDWGENPGSGIQNPPGHRDLIMDARMREIGIGYVTDTNFNNSVGPYVVTQHFAVDDATGPFLTGVIYDENNTDNFYTPGEGLGGVKIIATARENGQKFTTTTFASGGYALEVAAGLHYDIVASGPGLGQKSFSNVLIGSDNVKRDFITASPPLVGDANMDGLVNRFDIAMLAKRLGVNTGALWGDGDFNFDGKVSLSDLILLQQHLSPAGSPSFSPTAVPEPSTLALLSVGVLVVLCRNRQRRRAASK